MLEGVRDGSTSGGDAGWHVDLRVRGHQPRVRQGGHGQHLLRGTRFVGLGHGAVSEVSGIRGAGIGRVEGWRRRQGKDFTVVGVHHENRAGFRAGRRDAVGQRLFRGPLQIRIQGQRVVGSVHGWGEDAGTQRDATVGRAFIDLLSGGPGQLGVEHPLESRGSPAFPVDETDDVARECPVGVGAQGVVLGEQAVPATLAVPVDTFAHVVLDLGPGGRRNVPGNFRIPDPRGRQNLQVFGLGTPQVRGQDLRHGFRCRVRLFPFLRTHRVALVRPVALHHIRVSRDVHGRLGGGEHHPVAVGDGATFGQQFPGVLHLLRGLGGEALGLEGLQLNSASDADHHQQKQSHHERTDAYAGASEGQLPGATSPATDRTATHRSPSPVRGVASSVDAGGAWEASGSGEAGAGVCRAPGSPVR